MARVTVLKNIAEFEPSMVNIVMSSLINNSKIDKFDPTQSYVPGDKVYVIEDGKIIIKECINATTGELNDDDWVNVDNSLSGNTTQNPNLAQNISYFENKLVSDIEKLATRMNTISNLNDSDIKNMIFVQLFNKDDITLTKGSFDFGRIYT